MPATEKLTKVRGIPADCVWPGTPGRAFVVTLGPVEARRLASEATLAAERFEDVGRYRAPRSGNWPSLDTLSVLASELLCAGAAGEVRVEEAADVEAETMGGQCAPDVMQPPVRILRDPQLAKRLENQAATIARLQAHADDLRLAARDALRAADAAATERDAAQLHRDELMEQLDAVERAAGAAADERDERHRERDQLRGELRNSEQLREKLGAQLRYQAKRTARHNERVHQLEAFRVAVVNLAGEMRSASVNHRDAAQNGTMARASWHDGRRGSYEHAANALDELLAGAVAS